MKKKKTIAILGSTGSIGTQALEMIRLHPDRLEVYALTANNNVELLIRQAIEFQPEVVVIGNKNHYSRLTESLSAYPIKIFAGAEAIAQVAEMEPIDIVLTAMVGYSGLLPTIQAVKAGKIIALANKETLVVAGDLISKLVQKYHAAIIPVDSEHSAIFQCLVGEGDNPIDKIILTASGGPFRTKTPDELKHVTSAQALKHPNWNMGAKVTIDSASMMNKGFEAMEAKWLFNLQPQQIEVVVHPQSVIHSMVEFTDGSIKAQLGVPDMRLPIFYAFTYPERVKTELPRVDFSQLSQLTFEKPDTERFRNLELAFYAMQQGGNMPCILNAANEVLVTAFLKNRVGFLEMSDVLETILAKSTFIKTPSYQDYVETDALVRELTRNNINR